jgi:hypothetical protein
VVAVNWVWQQLLVKASRPAFRLVSTTCSNKTVCMKSALGPVSAKAG